MELLVLGVSPPTDIERRVRELQRELYAREALVEALALPVLVPLGVVSRPGRNWKAQPPSGRLESPRLATGSFTIQDRWLVWSVAQASDLLELAEAWGGPFAEPQAAAGPAGLLPLRCGFPLAFSRSPGVLQGALRRLGVEAARAFQPRALALHRLRPLAESPSAPMESPPLPAEPASPRPDHDTDPSGGASRLADWADWVGRGVYWEELGRKPLRRRT